MGTRCISRDRRIGTSRFTAGRAFLIALFVAVMLAACSSKKQASLCIPNLPPGKNLSALHRAIPADNRPAILLVGDSFTYGAGVRDNETVAANLQAMIDKNGMHYQVVNLGVGSYNTDLVRRRLELFLPRYPKTTLVIYEYFSNDNQPAYSALIYPLYQSPAKSIYTALFAGRSDDNWLGRRVRWRMEDGFADWSTQQAIKEKLLDCEVSDNVKGMLSLLREKKIPLLVFSSPHIEDPQAVALLQSIARTDGGTAYLPLQQVIEKEIPERDAFDGSYRLPDFHLNPKGNALVAEELFTELVERRYLNP